jgi:uncharacterized membrane protein YcaP (DUF421 family)
MRKLRYNLSDLLEQLRVKNTPNIADIEYAILETNGQLSIIPKAVKRPVNPEDLNLNPPYEGLPITLIMDGVLQKHNLEKANVTYAWLQNELKKAYLDDISQVLIASIDSQGNLFIQAKQL